MCRKVVDVRGVGPTPERGTTSHVKTATPLVSDDGPLVSDDGPLVSDGLLWPQVAALVLRWQLFCFQMKTPLYSDVGTSRL